MATISKLPEYSTKLFTEIYDNAEDFLTDYKGIGIPATITDTSATTLFYLLYSRYGNSPIANYDETQWKYKLFSIVFMYGPTWEKRLSIQEELRALTADQIKAGMAISRTSSGTVTSNGKSGGTTTTKNDGSDSLTGTTIGNHAYNPSTEPTTTTTSELDYIDQQNVNKDNKSTTSSETGEITNEASNTREDINEGKSGESKTIGTLDAYAQLWSLLDNDVTNDFLAKFINIFKKFAKPAHTWIYETEVDD